MKQIYTLACLLLIQTTLQAQCTNADAMGSSSNPFSIALNNARPLAVNNDLNTLVFLHRNNASLFGGHSGQLRYDLSTNNGFSWTSNLGPVNPLSVNGTNGARYPNAAIYNPPGNTDPNNAYLAYYGATVAATWGDHVSGVRRLNGTGNTETYNQSGTTQNLIPRSMCKGANGTMWAIDAINNGTQTTGYRVLKGTWNGTNDFTWAVNASFTPTFNTAYNGTNNTSDFAIAFDPSGQIGWVVFLADITVGPSSYTFHPIYYNTSDGGQTWSGPEQIDLTNFACVNSFITAGNVPIVAFETSLTVDTYGHPHTLLCVGSNPSSYSIYFTQEHRMFDITREYGIWNAMDLGIVTSGRSTFGTAPNQLSMDMNPQASRTDDGTKIFFAWVGSDPVATTNTPNLYGSAYDVVTKTWTSMQSFTSCNPSISGGILFPKVSENVLNVAGGWELPVAYVTPSNINDLLQPANFNYLDSVLFTPANFTTPQCAAAVTLGTSDSLVVCEGNAASLSVTSSHTQYLWSNGATTASTSVSTGGWQYITVRTDCCIGRDSVFIWIDSAATSAFSAIDNDLNVNFSDLSSGEPQSWLWDFGDGNLSTQQNPIHTFPAPGTYTVCLTVTDACGVDSSCQTLTVTCPVALPGFTSSIGNGGMVTFTNTTNPSATSYSWDFGDGNTSTLQDPTHVYATSGTYTVCLTVTDDCGTDTYCELLTVDVTLGLTGLETQAIRIYPNPTETVFYISGDLQGESYTASLVNVRGEACWQRTVSGNEVLIEVPARDLADGIYYLELSAESGIMRYKLVKQ
jgi:PKD repeat protein